MKRIFVFLLLALLLSGCAPQPSAETTPPTSTPTEASSTVTEPSSTASEALKVNVVFLRCFEQGQEYARITATDEQGGELWSVRTQGYDIGQIDRTSEIGLWQQQYYYVEAGDVVALDAQTGAELWRNPDFDGSPASLEAVYITDEGTVYLCGYFGPDFYAVNAQGQTLQQIPTLDINYYWAYKLTAQDGQVLVCFSAGPEGELFPEGHWIPVNVP